MRYILLLLRLIIISTILSVVLGGGYLFALRDSIPNQYEAGKEADRFARSIQRTVKRKAWVETGAIRWSMLNNKHLWDLRRGLVQTKFSDPEGTHDVLFDVDFKRYRVKSKRLEGPRANRWSKLSGDEATPIAERAYELWMRDRFILEPTQSLFNQGVERYLVQPNDDEKLLLAHYRRGGKNPGDSFLWRIDKNGLPKGIRVWSDQLYVSGLEMTMEKWRILKTGLNISTRRAIGPLSIDIKVSSAMSLTHLVGPIDPFKEIEGDPFDPPPTSQPNVLPNAKRRF